MKQGTVFFFLRVLISIFKKTDYQKLLIAFDGGGTNFRKNLLPQYKAQREAMPEELYQQMETVKLLLEKTDLTYLQLENQEADDLIASFVNQKMKDNPGLTFDVFTRDKDLLQLLSQNVNILKYINGKATLYTYDNFCQEYKFTPNSYIDYLSLLGDNVDNIEGIKGIGPVNAKKLIQQFQTVENIYQKINNLPEITKRLLIDQEKLVLSNKKLISLVINISLPDIYEKCNFS
ncbi:2574_t:CDS:1 [Funneliformis geosporum]|uniref:2574_t:CDS:1 n=1 Tax=Funneliformis geosporum TaxID=1117311 RepID=A0A9W4SYN5_9GLOM|nr:2574_t:CDS:1 [Funneliformis geosporum]